MDFSRSDHRSATPFQRLFPLGVILFCCLPHSAAAQPVARTLSSIIVRSSPIDDPRRVDVPVPSELALQRYRSGVVLWVVNQLWAVAVPSLFLFTGFSARIRTWAEARSRHWPVTLAIYLVSYSAITFAAGLPLTYYQGFVRPHAYGLSNQTMVQWTSNVMKVFLVGGVTNPPPPVQLPGIIPGFVVLAVLYPVVRNSPKRWWIYTGFLFIPMTVLMTLITPLWIDPLFNRFGPMKDKALEGQILTLAHRAGIDNSRVFEVDKSRDTKTINAYVTGIFGTKRIVLWDTTIAQLEPRELLAIMGHEMGHYALGHVTNSIMFLCGMLFLGLYAVHLSSLWMMARFKHRFAFDRLSDFASWPLILLLLNVASLVVAPLTMAFSRHQEHEADRFALEITHDNYGAGTAEVKLMERNLSVPSTGWFPELWRATHPSAADRIEFANEYRPWETGQPTRYDHLFRK